MTTGMLAVVVRIACVVAVLLCCSPQYGIATDPPARETRILKEIWNIGNDEDDPVLGMITRVLGDESGKVYLLDTRQHLVHILAADGQYLGTLGREGEGPGEVREPRDVLFMPDGTLGLLKRMPGGIVQLDFDGTPAGGRTIAGDAEGGFTSLQQVKRGGSHLVVLGRHSRPVEGETIWEYFLAPLLADDRLGPSYMSASARLGGSPPVFREKDHYVRMFMPWCVGPDGRVYFAPQRDRYAIQVCDPEGESQLLIERDFTAAKRSDDVRRNLHAAFESCTRGSGVEVEFVIEKNAPAVADLHVDPDGILWVRHARSLVRTTDGVVLNYDVFDADGQLMKQVALHGRDIGDMDGLYFLPGNRAVLVREHLFCRLVIDCQGSGSTSDAQDDGVVLPLVTYYEIE